VDEAGTIVLERAGEPTQGPPA
ncbi:MAG: hypothetical protein QOG42_1804, partial [Solirubrobacteraceae bacterium]|nr:hypothetical protein [Solirubrobacteraceae bacterium]